MTYHLWGQDQGQRSQGAGSRSRGREHFVCGISVKDFCIGQETENFYQEWDGHNGGICEFG